MFRELLVVNFSLLRFIMCNSYPDVVIYGSGTSLVWLIDKSSKIILKKNQYSLRQLRVQLF